MLRLAAVICLVMAVAPALLAAETALSVDCTGVVMDSQGKAVEGANVVVYEVAMSGDAMSARELGSSATDAEGRFAIPLGSAESARLGRQTMRMVLASREGFSLGWFDVVPDAMRSASSEGKITLEPPSTLAGTIVDESGAPIADAEVGVFLIKGKLDSMNFVMGLPPINALLAKTGADGRFSFDAVPPSATAEFLVKAPGMAALFTMRLDRGTPVAQFSAGQTDIRITLAKEAMVEGTVVDKESGKPVAGIAVHAIGKGPTSNPFAALDAVSAEDAAFRLHGMTAGEYTVRLAESTDALADWVASPVTVSAEAGKTISGIKVELEKGGILEVTVLDSASKKPVQGAYVNARVASGLEPVGGQTDQNGLVRKRVFPGDYKGVTAYKEGYHALTNSQKEFSIATGATERISIELTELPKLTGTVLDDTGKPLAGATVRTVQGFYSQPATTGEDGKFTISSQMQPNDRETAYAFATHAGRNLAAVFAIAIEDMSKPLEIRMLPGRSLKGRALDPAGNPLKGAVASATIWFGNYGSSIPDMAAPTGASGVYEIKNVPDGQSFSVDITAKGYGRKTIRVNLAESSDAVVTLDDAKLPIADKTVSGTVVDADGKGVEGARVWLYGADQAQSDTQSGRDGKFKFEGVADGSVEIGAQVPNVSTYGSSNAKAGDEDVTVVVREQNAGRQQAAPKPKPLVGRPIPDLKSLDAQADWTTAVEKSASKPILVVFFDSTQRPSRYAVSTLSQRAKDLDAKGVAVFLCDVSDAGAEATSQWAAKAGVSFPVAAIAKPEENQFAWGVQGLPWLVLADKSGTVKAEGFEMSQLDAKLAEIAQKR